MSKPLLGAKIAILVANGFNEGDMTQTQRALQAQGANATVIGMEQSLINSWANDGWGHHFAADAMLNTALAADYAMLVVPGGQRSLDKLKQTAHTRRFIGGFMDAGKPVALFNDAVSLLAFAERIDGRTVSCPQEMSAELISAGANVADDAICVDGNLITGYADDTADFVNAVVEHFSAEPDMLCAA